MPDWLQPPGDPVEQNPYPPGSPRHQYWATATCGAEEAAFRFNSLFSQKLHELDREIPPAKLNVDASVVWMSSQPRKLAALIVDREAGNFDIWANRGLNTVWTDADVAAYDQWLPRFAEAILSERARRYSSAEPDAQEALRDGLLVALRDRLTERIPFWKAEARQGVAKVKAHRESSRSAPRMPSEAAPGDLGRAGEEVVEQPKPKASKADEGADVAQRGLEPLAVVALRAALVEHFKQYISTRGSKQAQETKWDEVMVQRFLDFGVALFDVRTASAGSETDLTSTAANLIEEILPESRRMFAPENGPDCYFTPSGAWEKHATEC
jgi:hypothetical protein